MMNVNSDPMMAMILAAHTRSQIAMEDLSGLAEDQQQSNNLLKELRGLESELRKIRSDGHITRAELKGLSDKMTALQGKGVAIDAASFIAELEGQLKVAEGGGEHGRLVKDSRESGVKDGDYLWANAASPHENHKTNDKKLDSIKEAINDAKENVKAEVSNRELDIQRVTQEVSSAMQLQSNLSKRWSDVGNAIVGNMRA